MLLKRNDFTAADRALLILPLFHVNAIMLSVVVPLAAGASTYIADRFDAHAFWPWWKPNGRRTSRASRPSTSSSRCCRTTSGPTLRRCAWACAVPPRCRPTPSCANPIDDRRPGTVGLPFPGVDLAVVDDDGSPVPPGIDGEIVARGPTSCAATSVGPRRPATRCAAGGCTPATSVTSTRRLPRDRGPEEGPHPPRRREHLAERGATRHPRDRRAPPQRRRQGHQGRPAPTRRRAPMTCPRRQAGIPLGSGVSHGIRADTQWVMRSSWSLLWR